jgi:hypothetical protein
MVCPGAPNTVCPYCKPCYDKAILAYGIVTAEINKYKPKADEHEALTLELANTK